MPNKTSDKIDGWDWMLWRRRCDHEGIQQEVYQIGVANTKSHHRSIVVLIVNFKNKIGPQ